MIDHHHWITSDGHKITVFLEETGLACRSVPVGTGIGDGFKPEVLEISADSRILTTG